MGIDVGTGSNDGNRNTGGINGNRDRRNID